MIKDKTYYHKAKLQRWGNSTAIRLTKAMLDEAGFDERDNVIVEVEVETNKISVINKSKLTPFQQLFVGYQGDKPKVDPLWIEMNNRGKEEW